MRRREIVSLLIAAAAWPFAARAQPNGRIPVIGYPVSEADDRQMGCAAAFREGQRLELIKEVHPSLTRVGLLLLGRSDSPANRIVLDLANGTAAKLKIELMPLAVAGAGEVERALADAPGGPVGALVVDDAPTFLEDSAIIADVAQRRGLLSVGAPMFASAGGLLGYGVDFPPMFRRAATFVDKILKGAKPGDLPIEQATRFTTIVNLKTAAALGIDIPPTVLAAADEVIE